VGVPTNLIPTPITGLPEYTGSSTLGYLPYVLEGRSYKVQFANIAAVGAVPSSRVIAAGTGLAGGGDLSANRVISIAAGGVGFDQLALSGVVAGTYGSGSAIPILTVDSKGRVTSATTAPLDVTGFVPTSRTITAGDGLTGGGSLASNITLGANFSVVSPSALGVASPGTAVTLSRGDHVHPAVNLSDTTQTQGALPLGRGGTGDALSPVAGAVVYSTGSKFALTNPGIAGQVLVSNGTDEPQWQTIEGAGTVTSVNLTAGTGISVSGGPITVSGSINVVNTAPDQIVTLTGAGTTTISGTYPNFTITSNDSTVGTVTSVAASGGTTGLTFSGSPITSSGTLTLGGTLAVANGGTGASVAGTARTNLGAAASGANTDITSIALTTGTISASPVNGTDIVNKLYADSIASGINFHQSVRLATVTALPANTYNNGASGVGATLTANANAALSVDGVAVVVGNRILVKNEVAQANNGVYTVTQTGSGAAPYILTRATDFDSAGSGVDQIDAGDFFLVTAGSTQANTSWVQQTPLPITVGTTAIVFSQFAAPVLYTAGTGLTLAGTVFSITNTGVSASTYGSASSVPVLAINAQGQVTSASSSSIAIAASQVTSGTFTVAQGGTGATTLGANGVLLGNGTSAISATAVGTTGQVLVGNTGAAPTWATLSGIGVTSFSAGTTGLTPASATTGAITLAGTLNVANGGTGTSTAFTAGSVVFAGASGVYSQDNANLFWDNANDRLGISTTTPSAKLTVAGTAKVGEGAASNTSKLLVNTLSGVAAGIQLFQDANESWIIQNPASTSVLTFSASGSERMRITSAGDVGIGTTSLSDKLTVQGSGNFRVSSGNVGIALSGSGWSYSNYFNAADNSLRWYSSTGGDRMVLDSSGNLLVGTTSAVQRITAFGNLSGNNAADCGIAILRAGTTYGSNLYHTYSTTTSSEAFGLTVNDNTTLTNALYTKYLVGSNGIHVWYGATNATERMRIDSSGNVGIGTTSPATKLDVNGDATFRNGSGTIIGTVANSGGWYDFAGSANVNGTQMSHPGTLRFLTNSAERMRIGSTGDVGIGTTSYGGKLTIIPVANPTTASASTSQIAIGESSVNTAYKLNVGYILVGGSYFAGSLQSIAGSAGAPLLFNADGGNVGIGTYAPGSVLDIVGAGNPTITLRGSDGAYTSILNLQAAGAGTSVISATGGSKILGFLTNTVERMRIDANGNVGIGTTSLGAKFHVSGTEVRLQGSASFYSFYDTAGTTRSGYIQNNAGSIALVGELAQPMTFWTSNAERMRIDSSGNVGIGTSSPINRLTVSSGGDNGILLDVPISAAVFAEVRARYQGQNNCQSAIRFYNPNNGFGGAFTVWTQPESNGAAMLERMRVTETGNVGIGTSSPTDKLVLNTASNVQVATKYINSNTTGVTIGAAADGSAFVYQAAAQPFIVYTNATERMRIDSSGNVGIGTSSPVAKLQVVGTSRVNQSGATRYRSDWYLESGSVLLNGFDDTGGVYLPVGFNFSVYTFNSGASERMRITSGGNVLVNIGTVVQGGRFGVADTANDVCIGMYASGTGNTTGTYLNCGDDNNIRFRVFTNGNVQNTNNSYGAISDIKVKDNIEDATPKLQNLMQVRVVNYNLKTQPEQKHIGVVAQELEEIFPGLVEETADRDAKGKLTGETTKSVKYSVFVPMLIKALQEANEKIDTLAARVAQLEGN